MSTNVVKKRKFLNISLFDDHINKKYKSITNKVTLQSGQLMINENISIDNEINIDLLYLQLQDCFTKYNELSKNKIESINKIIQLFKNSYNKYLPSNILNSALLYNKLDTPLYWLLHLAGLIDFMNYVMSPIGKQKILKYLRNELYLSNNNDQCQSILCEIILYLFHNSFTPSNIINSNLYCCEILDNLVIPLRGQIHNYLADIDDLKIILTNTPSILNSTLINQNKIIENIICNEDLNAFYIILKILARYENDSVFYTWQNGIISKLLSCIISSQLNVIPSDSNNNSNNNNSSNNNSNNNNSNNNNNNNNSNNNKIILYDSDILGNILDFINPKELYSIIENELRRPDVSTLDIMYNNWLKTKTSPSANCGLFLILEYCISNDQTYHSNNNNNNNNIEPEESNNCIKILDIVNLATDVADDSITDNSYILLLRSLCLVDLISNLLNFLGFTFDRYLIN
jgi:hypothetical protein